MAGGSSAYLHASERGLASTFRRRTRVHIFLTGGASWLVKIAVIVTTDGRIITTGPAALLMSTGLILALGAAGVGASLAGRVHVLLQRYGPAYVAQEAGMFANGVLWPLGCGTSGDRVWFEILQHSSQQLAASLRSLRMKCTGGSVYSHPLGYVWAWSGSRAAVPALRHLPCSIGNGSRDCAQYQR